MNVVLKFEPFLKLLNYLLGYISIAGIIIGHGGQTMVCGFFVSNVPRIAKLLRAEALRVML